MNYSDTNVKNNLSFFAKVEILRILTSHFLPDLLPKVGQTEKVSFSTHTETHFLRFWEKKVENPARGASFAKVKVKIKKRTHTVYLFHFWFSFGNRFVVNLRWFASSSAYVNISLSLFLYEMSTVSSNDLNLELWNAARYGNNDAVLAAITAGGNVNWKNDSVVSENDI